MPTVLLMTSVAQDNTVDGQGQPSLLILLIPLSLYSPHFQLSPPVPTFSAAQYTRVQGHSLSALLYRHFFFFNFLAMAEVFKMLVLPPGIDPMLPAVEAQSLNLWTTREVPMGNFKMD